MTVIKHRSGTSVQWAAANPILAKGEMGFETDTNKFKMGNGSSYFSTLPYYINESTINDNIATLVEEQVDGRTSGSELGYAEITSDQVFTDTSTLATRISTLSIDITGTGRPVDIEFWTGEAWHETAGEHVVLYLCLNGYGLTGYGAVTAGYSPRTDKGVTAYMKRRIVLGEGVAANYTVGVLCSAAGNGHVKGDPTSPTFLSATSR